MKVSCPPFLRISTAGEGTRCLSDLKLWDAEPFGYSTSIGAILSAGDRVYAIAGAKNCSEKVYLSFNTNSTDRGEIKDLVRKDALNLCRSDPLNTGCNCELLLDNGASKLTSSAIDSFITKAPPMAGLPSKESLPGSTAGLLNNLEAEYISKPEEDNVSQELKSLSTSTFDTSSRIDQKPEGTETSKNLSRRKVALVIGNDNYKNVPKLKNAKIDARSVERVLKSIGYEVTMATDLSEKSFKRRLRDFESNLSGGEEVIFFYAGHGVEIKGANFLLPTDVGNENERQIEDEGIPLQRVLDDFSNRRAVFTLAILDACRDNPFRQSGRSIGGRGLAPTHTANGQMIVYSAGVGQQALDSLGESDTEQNGVFTRVLVRKIRESRKPVHQLMREVRSEVAILAKSVGHEQIPALYDQAIGDYFLRSD